MNRVTKGFKKLIIASLLAACTGGTIAATSLISHTEEVQAATGNEIVAYARTCIGKPYKWASTGPDSFDCSGLVQYVYKNFGTYFPNDSIAIYNNPTNYGTVVGYGSTANAKPGDLISWNGHIAIYSGNGNMIHAETSPSNGVAERKVSALLDGKNRYGEIYRASDYKVIRVYGVTDVPPPPPSSGKPQVDVSSGYYILQSAVGARNLDVLGANKNHNGNIYIWDAHGAFEGQIFYINKNTTKNRHYIQNINSKLFVSSYGNTNDKGVNVVQANGDGSDGQHWIFEDAGDGYVYIKNLYGYYLDVNNGTDANGTNVQVWTYNGGTPQKWKLVRVSGGALKRNEPEASYIIKSKIGHRFLDTDGRSKENGANMLIWYPNGAASQIFDMSWAYSREVTFKSKNSGLAVDCAIRGSYGNVVQSNDHPQWYQSSWFMEDAGDGYIYLRNLWGYYLDVYNSKDENGTNVQTWPFNGGNNQKWKLTKVSGKEQTVLDSGDYVIYSKIGNKVLNVEDNGTSDGSKLQIMSADKAKGNIFTIGRNGTLNATWIKRKDTDKFVDSSGQDAAGIARLWSGVGGYQQNWYLEDAGDGYYYIRNGWGYYLDVDDSVNEDGRRVLAWGYNGGDNQKWKFVPAKAQKTGRFSDVTQDDWYYKAVEWAAAKGIATGSNGKFFPTRACTREEAITFIWRMQGKPNPKSMKSKYSDVKDKNRYSYKAIMWGTEKGIITGKYGKFLPKHNCTREQIITMLWRLTGSPNPRNLNSKFSDVKNKNSYSYKAILWANQNGITTGGSGKFYPTAKCKRCDIVTFIYRYKN